MTYHFPDAYYGQNTKIREVSLPPARPLALQRALTLFVLRFQTLNNLILKSPQEWQTSVALPFVKIEGTVSLRFKPLLALRTAAQR